MGGTREEIWREAKNYDTIVDYFFWRARKKPFLGEVLINRPLLDQMFSLNPVTLEGQAEIIFNVFMYRLAKWKYNFVKVDESIVLTPSAPPAFAHILSQKERLESIVKSGLASAAQAVADYELLKHDERKYREILEYFKEGRKDDHVLRALFVDRVDAYTGEGYSMVSMAKRWPTIISDFMKMKEEWKDTETIRKNLKVSQAEAVVLKTKNELYKKWKRMFFPDVKERYIHIKTLLESRKRSIEEYRNWLKPYVAKLKVIREAMEIGQPSAIDIHDPTKLAHTPSGLVSAKFWIWKGIRPEEVGKPLQIAGWGGIPTYDEWVKENLWLLERKYDVKLDDKVVEGIIKAATGKTPSVAYKKMEPLAVYPALKLDEKFLYYFVIDLDYQCDYKKASTGPMIVEDQYWHFHPFIISKNFLLFMLIELYCMTKKFDREINELIGVAEVEERHAKKVEEEYGETEEKKKAKHQEIKFKLSLDMKVKHLRRNLKPLRKYFFRPGPYESTILERISKEFGNYSGTQIAELLGLIMETCYRISGVRP